MVVISDKEGSNVKGSTYDCANMEKPVLMAPNIKETGSQSVGNLAHEQTHSKQERGPFCYIPYGTDFAACSAPAQQAGETKERRQS